MTAAAADIFVGVDAGGSGCRVRVADAAGRVLGRAATPGPANLLRQGAVARIAGAVAEALAQAGNPADDRVALCVGAAGATGAGRAAFHAHPWAFAGVRLMSDAHAAALGAHGGRPGGVAILGTGAVGLSLDAAGRVRLVGGWGHAVDDAGSGVDIGRRALRAVLRAVDEGRERTPLAQTVLARFGGPEALCDWAAAAAPGDIAALAPTVFDHAAEDPAAAAIVARAAVELARLVRLVAANGAPQVAALGSVAARVTALCPPDAAALLSPPHGDAVDGALLAAAGGLGYLAGEPWGESR